MAPAIQLPLACAALLIAAYSLFCDRKALCRPAWPMWIFGALALWTAFALLPLPKAILQVFSPHVSAFYDAGNVVQAPPAAPLSLDPPSTVLGVCVHCALFACMCAATQKHKNARLRITAALAIAGSVSALLALIAYACSARWSGPFRNPNHQASLCILSALAAWGLLFRDPQSTHRAPLKKPILIACIAIPSACICVSQSRGGLCAYGLGLAGFFWAAARRRPTGIAHEKRLQQKRRLRLCALACFTCITAIPALWICNGRPQSLQAELKVQLWKPLARYIADFWLTGSGRASFAFVYPHYQQIPMEATVSHPENVIFQILCDWGLVGLLCALALGVGCLWQVKKRGLRSMGDLGLFCGLIAVGCHQLCDFGWETLGLALPSAAAFGVLMRPKAPKEAALQTDPQRLQTRFALLPAAFCAASAVLLLWPGLAALKAKGDLAALQQTEGAAFLKAAQTTTLRHPADPFVALAVASKLEQKQVELAKTTPWIERARWLFPVNGQAAWLLARARVQQNRPNDAALFYAKAFNALPLHQKELLLETLKALPELEARQLFLNEAPSALPRLSEQLLLQHQPDQLHRLLRQKILEQGPDRPSFAWLAKSCLAERDFVCAEAIGRVLVRLDEKFRGQLTLALVQASQKSDFLTPLEAAASAAKTADEWRELHKYALQLEAFDVARRATDALLSFVGGDPASLADLLHRRAQTAAAQNRPDEALALWEKALTQFPAPAIARTAADYAQKHGFLTKAQKFQALAR